MKRKSIFLRCFAIVLVYSCLGIQQVSAQDWDHEYVPFVEEGKVWNCTSFDNYDYNIIDCVLTMQGDTLIGNHRYKKVLCEYEKFFGDNTQHYYCAVREEAYQVFFVAKDASEEKFLYDFRSPEDTLYFSYSNKEYARDKGHHLKGYPSRQYFFQLFKLIDGEVNARYGQGTWLEGVGNYNGNPFNFILDIENSEAFSKIFVISCMAGDKCVFDLDWLSQPSLITGELIKAKPYRGLFDLQGRRIQGEPKHGVYIQNGKKVMR
jgi:hypothetical protein